MSIAYVSQDEIETHEAAMLQMVEAERKVQEAIEDNKERYIKDANERMHGKIKEAEERMRKAIEAALLQLSRLQRRRQIEQSGQLIMQQNTKSSDHRKSYWSCRGTLSASPSSVKSTTRLQMMCLS
jgi:hypothetical protein